MPVPATLPRSQWLWSKTQLRRKNPFSRRWKHKTSDVPFLPVDRPADMFVEAVRGLRTNLHFTMMEAENRIVIILLDAGLRKNAGGDESGGHRRAERSAGAVY